jgi:DNA-binding transcriptional LysR family regulator
MDRLDRLRTFIAVAEHESFAAAARKLRLSPAAATRAIANLEQDLGCSLFRRTTRSVRLTPEGAAYLDRCGFVLAELDDATRQIRGENAEPQGELVIGAPVVFGRLHALAIAADLLKTYPGLTIRLLLSDRNMRLAEEGIDLALRIGVLSDSALHARKLGEVSWVLVAAPDYLKNKGNPRAPADLAGHAIIAFDQGTGRFEWTFGNGSHVRFKPRLAVNTAESAIDAASAGLGITRVLSYQVAEAVRAGRLMEILPAFAPAPLPIHALFQANRQGTPNVRAFVDAAVAYFKTTALILPNPPKASGAKRPRPKRKVGKAAG